MAVYERKNSPFWWMYLEGEGDDSRCSTKILIGATKGERKASREAADKLYHAAALKAGKIATGIEPKEKAALPTFATFAAWYDANHIARHKGQEREREILKRLTAAFGAVALDAITKTAAIEWRTKRLSTPVVIAHFGGPKGPRRTFPPPSHRTVNREIDLLQQILAAAVPEHFAVSPIAGLPNLDVVEPVRRMMTEAEESKVLAQLAPADRAVLIVGLDGLVRLGDILDLKRADDHGKTLTIRAPKNGRAHEVPVSARMRVALDSIPVEADAPEYFFAGRRGAATERDWRAGFAKALQRACQAAGVPYGRAAGGLTFHWSTRRTGATRAIRRLGEKGVAVVKQIGNWKDASVLIGIYQDVSMAEMAAAVETIGVGVKMPKPLKLLKKKKAS